MTCRLRVVFQTAAANWDGRNATGSMNVNPSCEVLFVDPTSRLSGNASSP